MPFEIEMLSLGNADSSIIRYIDEQGEERIIVIDAGHKGDGEKVVALLEKYSKNKKIDLAICTHPDADHIEGFFHIVENYPIDEFWIHDPLSYAVDISSLKEAAEDSGLEKSLSYLLENLNDSKSLIRLIDEADITRKEPFAGLRHDFIPIAVIGPTMEFYIERLSRFRDIDKLVQEDNALKKGLDYLIFESEKNTAVLLNSKNEKSHENNSSAIICFYPNERKFLFTSDAGPLALEHALSNSNIKNVPEIRYIYWMTVPHHGSIYNLNTDIITAIHPEIACISCKGKNGYPHSAVVTELDKINCRVYSTGSSGNLLYRNLVPKREGYNPAKTINSSFKKKN
jgi:beta-lactamase superfamily II metal-dependent hydrolase